MCVHTSMILSHSTIPYRLLLYMVWYRTSGSGRSNNVGVVVGNTLSLSSSYGSLFFCGRQRLFDVRGTNFAHVALRAAHSHTIFHIYTSYFIICVFFVAPPFLAVTSRAGRTHSATNVALLLGCVS